MAIASGNSRFTDALLAADGLAAGYSVSMNAPDMAGADIGSTQVRVDPIQSMVSTFNSGMKAENQEPVEQARQNPALMGQRQAMNVAETPNSNKITSGTSGAFQRNETQIGMLGQQQRQFSGAVYQAGQAAQPEATMPAPTGMNAAFRSFAAGTAAGAVIQASSGLSTGLAGTAFGLLDAARKVSNEDVAVVAKTQGTAAAQSLISTSESAPKSDLGAVPKVAPADPGGYHTMPQDLVEKLHLVDTNMTGIVLREDAIRQLEAISAEVDQAELNGHVWEGMRREGVDITVESAGAAGAAGNNAEVAIRTADKLNMSAPEVAEIKMQPTVIQPNFT